MTLNTPFVILQMLSKNSFISTNHFFKGTKQLYLGEYYSMCGKSSIKPFVALG